MKKQLTPEEIDELVYEAERIVSSVQSQLAGRSSETGRSQMSNAIDAAQQTRSIPMFINWVRYQMSREEFWKTAGDNGKTLGQMVSDFAERLKQEAQDDEGRERALEKLTLFLGFMRRALVAIKQLNAIPAQFKGGGRP
ncbi:MAG: hypothetical protein SNJ72_08390 [Fimbriimonadales bacterium]